ncbi:SDR family NAD(P)-dependent oxidoreductase [Amycolatopsis jejuensis]|uniref:SDR family NAD(P)-dependent oxidoreductase n=1 Tax=Amycolatopsis jejuensis TaxID=330084 RepID=UPI00068FB37D|nr:SDR family oxidoreductase [Amycolatopsis jejuensis]
MEDLDRSPVPDYPSLLRLDGRTFVVVGAGQGMGRQTAHALASAGAHVACADLDKDRAGHVAVEIAGTAYQVDAADPEQIEAMLTAVRAQAGRIHGICDVIGMARWSKVTEMPDEDWDWSFDLVLRHAYLLIKIGGRMMAEDGGGAITCVSSISGISSAPYHGAYGAYKAAMISFVRTASVELAPANVRVNTIAPGAVATPRLARDRGLDVASMADGSLTKMAQTADIGSAMLYLSSDLGKHVNGHTLVVDGGTINKFPIPLDGADARTPGSVIGSRG